jgi:hypothetical protein
VKIPSKIALCNPDGKMEPTPSVMVWCTAKPEKGTRKKTNTSSMSMIFSLSEESCKKRKRNQVNHVKMNGH